MSFIEVKQINKTFKVPLKSTSKFGALKTFFSRKYKYIDAIKDISFSIDKGEIVGYIGPNGAGKTTTFRMILGLLDDYEGNITIDGEKINYDITDKIGFLTEERSLLTKLTVLEQIIYYGVLKSMKKDKRHI